MTTEPGQDLTRITLIYPVWRLDLALPHNVPIDQLLPVILEQCRRAVTTADATNVVLKRADSTGSARQLSPLPDRGTLVGARVLDGETLYLMPKGSVVLRDAIPPISGTRGDVYKPTASGRWGKRRGLTRPLGRFTTQTRGEATRLARQVSSGTAAAKVRNTLRHLFGGGDKRP